MAGNDDMEHRKDTEMILDEFEAEYAKHCGMTVEQLRALGLRATPCDCGERYCDGYRMSYMFFISEIEHHKGIPKEKNA